MKKEDIKAQVTLVMCEFLYIRKCDAAEVKKKKTANSAINSD